MIHNVCQSQFNTPSGAPAVAPEGVLLGDER